MSMTYTPMILFKNENEVEVEKRVNKPAGTLQRFNFFFFVISAFSQPPLSTFRLEDPTAFATLAFFVVFLCLFVCFVCLIDLFACL